MASTSGWPTVAATQSRSWSCKIKMSGDLIRRCSLIARVFLAALLVVSLLAATVAIVPLSTATAANGEMDCCMGQSGHCLAQLSAKPKPPPEPEPMCGMHSEGKSSGDPLVAIRSPENSAANSRSPNAVTISLSRPCPKDCGAGAFSTVRRPKPRETALSSDNVYARRAKRSRDRFPLSRLVTSTSLVEQSRPRGPPAFSS